MTERRFRVSAPAFTAHRFFLPALLAILSGGLVVTLAWFVFPYHSINHDEAVYLQHAEMLLQGRLTLSPPVEDAFRPWFFVDGPDGLYPKYAPVIPALFAVGKLLGGARLALGAIAAANVFLCFLLVRSVFDRREGLVAAGLFAASPLFLVNSALFLPYAPTTMLNLSFGVAYFRADSTGRLRWAALAGGAIGLAFFARPYTSVLFALPFIAHALWTLWRGVRTGTGVGEGLLNPLRRLAATASVGLVGVVVTLGYNLHMTGSVLRFPYLAFAPEDGLGFGYHSLLEYGREYSIPLALEANWRVLSHFGSDWFVAGLLGTGLAVAGVGLAVASPVPTIASGGRGRRLDGSAIDDRSLVLLGIALSVALGNVYFWGNLNILGDLQTVEDGFVHYLGPYYHFDLLVPAAGFAAYALTRGADTVRRTVHARFDVRTSRAVVLVILVVLTAVGGAASAATGTRPLAENREITAIYEQAYEPFEDRSLEDALVFLPTPQGDWLAHPFQALRNDPGFRDSPVYALSLRRFAVLDAFPNRTVYQYGYRGQWAPRSGERVDPVVRELDVVRGERLHLASRLTVPETTERVSVMLLAGTSRTYGTIPGNESTVQLNVTVADGRAVLEGESVSVGSGEVGVDDGSTVVLSVFADYGTGGGVTYRYELPIERVQDGYRGLGPLVERCTVPFRCGGEAVWIPDREGAGTIHEVTLAAS